MFNLNNYLMKNRNVDDPNVYGDVKYPIVPRITCKDGFSLSVQANHGAYCCPRSNIGEWTSVEVGFPSAPPELIMGYAESEDSPTDTVYGYVPIRLVEELIEMHGGV